MILLTCLSCFLNYFTLGGNRLTLSQSFYSKKDFRLQPAAISIKTLRMPQLILVYIALCFSIVHYAKDDYTMLRLTFASFTHSKHRAILFYENLKNDIEFLNKSSFLSVLYVPSIHFVPPFTRSPVLFVLSFVI